MNWHRISQQIEDRKWEIQFERGIGIGGVSDGIMVMDDPLALEYQRLERIQRHVGCHFCRDRDLAHGMKTAICRYRG